MRQALFRAFRAAEEATGALAWYCAALVQGPQLETTVGDESNPNTSLAELVQSCDARLFYLHLLLLTPHSFLQLTEVETVACRQAHKAVSSALLAVSRLRTSDISDRTGARAKARSPPKATFFTSFPCI